MEPSPAATRPAVSTRRRPAGSEAYGEEQSWNYEGGVKARMTNGRVAPNAAAFFIDWNDLQLNVPNPTSPGAILHRQRRVCLEQGGRVRR